jgi:hypothetical protein
MLFTLLGSLLIGCGGDPVRSSCEATCDWAVSCQEADRPVDAAALTESCLTATRAEDASCEKAESGSMDPASKKLLESCVAEIDAKATAAECDVFTGIDPEAVPSTDDLPGACITQGDDAIAVFEAARFSTSETGADLCVRYTESFCAASAACILGDFGGQIPQQVIDELGTPEELCAEKLSSQTDSCVTNDLYAAEESLDDTPNSARYAARRCLSELSSLSCEQINNNEFPEECAGSRSSAEENLAFATALFEVAQEFESAADAL